MASMANLLLPLSLLLTAWHQPFLCHAARHHHSRQAAARSASSMSRLQEGSALFPNGTGVTRASFPDDFLFGAITSSMKHEGAQYKDNKTQNIWDVFALRDRASQDGSIPGECGDNYDLFKIDHGLAAGLGMNSYRFSIAWSRVFPHGSGDVNELAIAHYNEVINDVLDQGLVPMVSLWTQDHPQALEASYGGALDAQFITDFVNYADTCFKAFGDRVKLWITFDEANDWSGLAYSTNQNPPGRCTSDIRGQMDFLYGQCAEGDSGTEPYIVAHNMLLAHAEAVDLYRTKYQPSQNGSIGQALWFRWLEPYSNSTADVTAAQRGTEFLIGWFLDPIFFGDYPASMREFVGSRLPNFTTEEISKIQGSVDFIGLNLQAAYYAIDTDFYQYHDEKCYYLDWHVNVTGDKDGVPMGPGTTEYAVPWCMRKGVEYVKDRYNNFPMYITQTGWGISYNESVDTVEETLEDDERVEFYETFYDELRRAIRRCYPLTSGEKSFFISKSFKDPLRIEHGSTNVKCGYAPSAPPPPTQGQKQVAHDSKEINHLKASDSKGKTTILKLWKQRAADSVKEKVITKRRRHNKSMQKRHLSVLNRSQLLWARRCYSNCPKDVKMGQPIAHEMEAS